MSTGIQWQCLVSGPIVHSTQDLCTIVLVSIVAVLVLYYTLHYYSVLWQWWSYNKHYKRTVYYCTSFFLCLIYISNYFGVVHRVLLPTGSGFTHALNELHRVSLQVFPWPRAAGAWYREQRAAPVLCVRNLSRSRRPHCTFYPAGTETGSVIIVAVVVL